jgi:hypothetical protein
VALARIAIIRVDILSTNLRSIKVHIGTMMLKLNSRRSIKPTPAYFQNKEAALGRHPAAALTP